MNLNISTLNASALGLFAVLFQAAPASLSGSAISLIVGILLNAGALAWWIRSGTDMKLAQRDSVEARKDAQEAKAKTMALESRVNQQDTIINEIRLYIRKLDRVDEVVNAVKYIEEAVTHHMVPRAELEVRWNAQEARMKRVEEDVQKK